MSPDFQSICCLFQGQAPIPATLYADLAYIGAAVLLPLLPAYLLYRTLPAQAGVTGVFSKFNIKLSGAFAGYFALVLVVLGFIQSRPKEVAKDRSSYEVYTIYGNLDMGDEHDFSAVRLSLWPPDQFVSPKGMFQFNVPAATGQAGAKLPSLIIEKPGYEPQTVSLDPIEASTGVGPQCRVEIHKDAKMINITGGIPLRKIDSHPYSPNPSVIEPVKGGS